MITSSEGLKTSSLQHLDDTSQLRPPEDPWPMSVSDGLGGYLDWAKTRRKGKTSISKILTFQKMSSDQHCGQQVFSLRKVRPGTENQRNEELEIFHPQEQQVLLFLCFTLNSSSEVFRDQCFYCAEISSLDTNVLRWDIIVTNGESFT